MQNTIVRDVLEEFTKHILDIHIKKHGLFGGKLGVSIFLLHHDSIFKNNKSQKLAYQYIDDEQNVIKDKIYKNSFASEMSSFIWTMFTLDRSELIEIDKTDYTEVLPFINNEFEINLQNKHYDPIYGNIALARSHRYLIPPNDFFNKYLDFLNNSAEYVSNQAMWEWKNKKTNDKGYNLGLAHGAPGILLFLNQLFEIKQTSKIVNLMRSTSHFLINQLQDVAHIGSYFPSTVMAHNVEHLQWSRLAWCYGDIGVAFSLLKTARNLNDKDLYQKSLEILGYCTTRLTAENTGVRDIGICHGSSGLVLLFDKIFKFTNDLVFKKASDYWLDYSLTEIVNKGSIENLIDAKLLNSNEYYGFLEGISGVGLVLLSRISDKKTYWEESLLL